jgi:hypothetical protein
MTDTIIQPQAWTPLPVATGQQELSSQDREIVQKLHLEYADLMKATNYGHCEPRAQLDSFKIDLDLSWIEENISRLYASKRDTKVVGQLNAELAEIFGAHDVYSNRFNAIRENARNNLPRSPELKLLDPLLLVVSLTGQLPGVSEAVLAGSGAELGAPTFVHDDILKHEIESLCKRSEK